MLTGADDGGVGGRCKDEDSHGAQVASVLQEPNEIGFQVELSPHFLCVLSSLKD